MELQKSIKIINKIIDIKAIKLKIIKKNNKTLLN